MYDRVLLVVRSIQRLGPDVEANTLDEDDVIYRDLEVQNSRQLRNIALDNSIFSMGNDRIRRFVADHSFGQAPDKRDPQQHFNIRHLYGHDPSDTLPIHCRYGVSFHGIHDSLEPSEVALTLRVSAGIGRRFERTTQTAFIAIDWLPDLTNTTALKRLSSYSCRLESRIKKYQKYCPPGQKDYWGFESRLRSTKFIRRLRDNSLTGENFFHLLIAAYSP